jgi:hypothetical protein
LTFFAKATTEFTLPRLHIYQSTAPWTKYGFFNKINLKIYQEWSEYNLKFTATHSATDAQLRMYLGQNLPQGQSLILDDISLKEIITDTISVQYAITTYLNVFPGSFFTEEVAIFKGENYFGWTEPGSYERIFTDSNGCDSIIYTNLSVIQKTDITNDGFNFYSISNNESVNFDSEKNNILNLGIHNRQQEGNTFSFSPKASSIEQKRKNFSEREFEFSIYPNPAQSYINVNLSFIPIEETFIEVLNSNGQSFSIQKVNSVNSKIELHSIPPGMYYLRTYNSEYVSVQKFIKE